MITKITTVLMSPPASFLDSRRFGSALNVNVPLHVLAFDGIFREPDDEDARPEFSFLGDPSDHDVERLLAA